MKDYNVIWRGLFGKNYDSVETTDPEHLYAATQKQQAKFSTSKKCEKRRRALTYALLGTGALMTGLFILIVDPHRLLYEWKITFGPGGEIFSLWEKPPVELFLKVYLWNVTNSEEYMSGQADKLKFQEVGPYVYRELMTHENVSFNDNGTLSSNPNHPLFWEAELSGERKEDDLLILPNIALLSIADVAAKKSFITRMGLNVIIRQTKSQPLIKMTAREFMFGYKSTLMDLGNTFMPSWIYFDKLGLIDRMYEFRGDYETVFTGTQHGLSNIGLLDKYNGDTRIPQWESPCGDVTGSSDGTKFPGYIKPNDTLLFFRKSMCRAKAMIHINDTTVDGFEGYRYRFATDVDDNGRIHDKNRCFCKQEDIDKCLPNDLLDVRGCYYGFPIALSYPHFYEGDPILFNKVESGLNPDPAKHESFFVIEPRSGMPLKLAVRYQINMALGDLGNIANTHRFNDMVLPMLWMEIGMYGLTTNLKIRFKLYLDIIPMAQTIFMYVSFVFSVGALIYSIYKFTTSRTKSNQHPWIEDAFVLNIDRKLSSYIPEKKGLPPREMDTYFNSLVTPLNAVLDRNTAEEA